MFEHLLPASFGEHPPFVEQHDMIREPRRVQAVRDDDDGHRGSQRRERSADRRLALGVERGSRFVQHEQPRPAQ